MADVLAHTSTFTRGSGVLEYWLLNAEGFTIEPLGATVERVVVSAPFEPPVALVVHDPRGRERMISADAIAAVEPKEERLLLDPRAVPRRRRRPSAARAALVWLRPRAAHVAIEFARCVLDGARLVALGLAWLTPRALAALQRVASHPNLVRLRRTRFVRSATATSSRDASGDSPPTRP